MNAFVRERYGGMEQLELRELPTPTPGRGQVLVRVHAVSLNRSDWESLTGRPAYVRVDGLRRPRHHVLGSDIAGRVAAVGDEVEGFRRGDEVYGDVMADMGGFAEYACVRASSLVIKPATLPFEVAAALPQSAVIALQGVGKAGRVEAGQRVLINGGGGGVGVFAVQLAKARGAEVTGVDHAEKLDFMTSLGSDHVIDYAKEDFTRRRRRYDFVLDVIGGRPIHAYRRTLASDGSCFIVGGPVPTLLKALVAGRVGTGGKRVGVLIAKPSRSDLETVADLVARGEIACPSQRFPFDQLPEALRTLGEGRGFGKLVVTHGDTVATGPEET